MPKELQLIVLLVAGAEPSRDEAVTVDPWLASVRCSLVKKQRCHDNTRQQRRAPEYEYPPSPQGAAEAASRAWNNDRFRTTTSISTACGRRLEQAAELILSSRVSFC